MKHFCVYIPINCSTEIVQHAASFRTCVSAKTYELGMNQAYIMLISATVVVGQPDVTI